MFSTIFVLMVVLANFSVFSTKYNIVEDILIHSQIIPDVIDRTAAHTSIVWVRYDPNNYALFGNEFTPMQVSSQPHVNWLAKHNALYTLSMTDPDAPSRQTPYLAEFNHWLVVNIPRNSVYNGNTVAGYVGPAPPPGVGPHRYVFLVYRQLNRIPVIQLPIFNRTDYADRYNFSIRAFAQQFNLGDPIAANFFVAQSIGA